MLAHRRLRALLVPRRLVVPWAIALSVLVQGCAIATSAEPLATGDLVRIIDPKAGSSGRGHSIIEGRVRELSDTSLVVKDDTGAVFTMDRAAPFHIHRRDGRRGGGIIQKAAVIGAIGLTATMFARDLAIDDPGEGCLPVSGCPSAQPLRPLGSYIRWVLLGAAVGTGVGYFYAETPHWSRVAWPRPPADAPR